MEYSKENTMTRKEYLKSKKKNKFDVRKLKYFLLIVVVILLSIYLFKQLNIYNTVTQMANKVVEQSALAKTMTMYYVEDSYTRDKNTVVMLYKSTDESRTRIENSENLSNITIIEDKLYGIKENLLFCINLQTNNIEQVLESTVKLYCIRDNTLFFYTDGKQQGLYKYDLASKKLKQLTQDTIYQLEIVQDNIFVIAKGKTSKSIIKYDLEGNSKKLISDTYIVNYMHVSNNTIYFVNSKDGKIYSVSNDGNDLKKIIDSQIYLSGNNDILLYENNIIYINKSDENTLHRYDLNSGKDERIIKKNVTSIQHDKNIVYYKVKNSIGIYKYDMLTGKTSQVTSVRTSEYICKN